MKSMKKYVIKTLIVAFAVFAATNNANAQQPKPFQLNGKWGLKNSKGGIIVKPKYNEIQEFSEGFAIVTIKSELDDTKILYGFIDKTGKEITKLEYQGAKKFSEGKAVVYGVGDYANSILPKYGFINTTGFLIIDFKYEDAESFSGGVAVVGLVPEKSNEILYGLTLGENEDLTEFKYKKIGKFNEGGLASIEIKIDDNYRHNRFGFIDRLGKETIKPEYNKS